MNKLSLISLYFNKYFINDKSEKDLIEKLLESYQKNIKNYSQLEKIVNYLYDKTKCNIPKFLYFIKNYFHKQLYFYNEIFYLNFDGNKIDLSYYFYLDKLIIEEPFLINYKYSFNLIERIGSEIKKENNNKFKIFILSKIALDLIDNFEQIQNFQQKNYKKEIIEYKKYFIDVINNEKNIFLKLNLYYNIDFILKKNIDDIYIDIIKSLINYNKFEDFKFINDIICQLDLENIYPTEEMLHKLNEFLNINISQYKISNFEDLVDCKKINFYYFLLKYILKNKNYIYKFPFLSNSQKSLIKIIKYQLNKILVIEISNDEINKKIDFIIKTILDNDYYYDKYSDFMKLKQVYYYYHKYLFNSKEKELKLIKEIFQNNKNYNKNNYKEYLVDYYRIKIIEYIFNSKKDKNDFKKSIDNWEKIEKSILEEKLIKIPKDDIELLYNYIENEENNKKILLKILKDKYDYLIKYIYNQNEDSAPIMDIKNLKEKYFIKKETKDNLLSISTNISITFNENNSNLFKYFSQENENKKSKINLYHKKLKGTINFLATISNEESKRVIKTSLFLLKKTNLEDKNGVLLIHPELSDIREMKGTFYETKDFEPYYFCPIFVKIYENKNNINNLNKSNFYDNTCNISDDIIDKVIKNNYFLIGGFDNDKNVAKLLICKILFDEFKIKYFYSFEFEIKSPIIFIIQSKENGDILVNLNQNIYVIPCPYI